MSATSAPRPDQADAADQADGAGESGATGESGAGPAVPAATFQPPLVIFQPPEISFQAPESSPARPPAGGQAGRRRDPVEADGPAADATGDGQGQAGGEHEHEDDGETGTRRRRRGGRGHSKARGADDAADGAARPADTRAAGQQAEAGDQGVGGEAEHAGDEGEDGAGTGPRRRRRRRRSGSGGDGGDATPDDPPNTVVHVRAPRQATTDVTDVRSVKGSTRLEAKRQRRREGRESGRRRPPIITESEFLARREAVQRVMVVRQRGDRTQIAVLEDGVLVEHYVDKASHQSYVGNVYLGKVQNVLPSMEAAFVDVGKGRNAVLYAGEVNFDASGLEGESKRIESALKSGQSILVQVTKDPIGHKGARLTSQISLPGRYLVYVPGSSMTGISRKLPDTERTRLKQILRQVMPEGAGVIVRTAAEGASEEELSRDVSRLAAQWEAIDRKAKTATAPDLLYSEPDLTIRVVRDIFNEDFGQLVIASDAEWDMVDDYVRYVAPHLAERLERWEDDNDVFAAYRIDEQLAKALERKVWLPSGGSLVIDNTEAMTVVDVNTGKFTGHGGNLEQTVTRNNLEAAEEIVRQLRLRDVGGIIVIDFIDMVLESNRELVLRRLLECLARDRTKHQVAEVTSLGLVQMTRKRVGAGLLEAFSVTCEHCNGRGVLVSMEPVEHTPPRGRDEDGHGKDDGRSRGGRGARGGKQAKGDSPRGDSPRGGGRAGSAAQADGHFEGTGPADNSGYRDDSGRRNGAHEEAGHHNGAGRSDDAARSQDEGRPDGAGTAGTGTGGTAGTAGTAHVDGPAKPAQAGRSGRGRAVRSAGPAAPETTAPDSAVPSGADLSSAPLPDAAAGSVTQVGTAQVGTVQVRPVPVSAAQGSAAQGSADQGSAAPGGGTPDNGAGPAGAGDAADGAGPDGAAASAAVAPARRRRAVRPAAESAESAGSAGDPVAAGDGAGTTPAI